MIADLSKIWQDMPLLSDELLIIAGEANGLTKKDRESLRKSSLLVEELLRSYRSVFDSLNETHARLVATEERLREANASLAHIPAFPPLSATGQIVGYRL